MHEVAFLTALGLVVCLHKPECVVTTSLDSSIMITIVTWHLPLKNDSCFSCFPHCYVTWRPLTRGIVFKGPCARDALLHTFGISAFNSSKNNSTTIKHISLESANSVNNCNVVSDTSGFSISYASVWNWEHGGTRSPSLHTRLFDAETNLSFPQQSTQSSYDTHPFPFNFNYRSANPPLELGHGWVRA